jgi:hypothetical protein
MDTFEDRAFPYNHRDRVVDYKLKEILVGHFKSSNDDAILEYYLATA